MSVIAKLLPPRKPIVGLIPWHVLGVDLFAIMVLMLLQMGLTLLMMYIHLIPLLFLLSLPITPRKAEIPKRPADGHLQVVFLLDFRIPRNVRIPLMHVVIRPP